MFQYSLTERTVPVSVPGKRFRRVPVPRSVPGKTVPTVPVSGSGSVPGSPWNYYGESSFRRELQGVSQRG